MREFQSTLDTPWGSFRIEAGLRGVTAILCGAVAEEGTQPVPYDLAHAWNAYETGLSDTLHLPIDLSASPKVQKFYLAIRQIPRGEEKELAVLAVQTGLTAEEGQKAMEDCPLPLAIPLHRVPQWRGLPEETRRAIVAFEQEHPRLPRFEAPWGKK